MTAHSDASRWGKWICALAFAGLVGSSMGMDGLWLAILFTVGTWFQTKE